MHLLKYFEFIKDNGLNHVSHLVTIDGEVVWGISLDKHGMLMVHDSFGRAYKGLRIAVGESVNYDDIHPAYGNTALKLLPMVKGSIKIKNVIYKQGEIIIWGVGGLGGNRHLVCDRYNRLFMGLDLMAGEKVRKEGFSLAYHGSILVPCPSLNVYSDMTGILY